MGIFKFTTLTSTNDYMKNNFRQFKEYDIVTAENQTAGKARRGNCWVSQKGMALFTFMVKKKEYFSSDDSEYLKIPLLAGLAVIKGLEKSENFNYMFKWTNDVYLEGKKMSGILVEKVEDTFFIGIGININNSLPEELGDKAVSLTDITGRRYDIDKIITDVIDEFKILYKMFTDGRWNEILAKINSLNYLKGKEVTLKTGERKFRGVVRNINYEGEIEIISENEVHSFSIGEVFEEGISFLR